MVINQHGKQIIFDNMTDIIKGNVQNVDKIFDSLV